MGRVLSGGHVGLLDEEERPHDLCSGLEIYQALCVNRGVSGWWSAARAAADFSRESTPLSSLLSYLREGGLLLWTRVA